MQGKNNATFISSLFEALQKFTSMEFSVGSTGSSLNGFLKNKLLTNKNSEKKLSIELNL